MTTCYTGTTSCCQRDRFNLLKLPGHLEDLPGEVLLHYFHNGGWCSDSSIARLAEQSNPHNTPHRRRGSRQSWPLVPLPHRSMFGTTPKSRARSRILLTLPDMPHLTSRGGSAKRLRREGPSLPPWSSTKCSPIDRVAGSCWLDRAGPLYLSAARLDIPLYLLYAPGAVNERDTYAPGRDLRKPETS